MFRSCLLFSCLLSATLNDIVQEICEQKKINSIYSIFQIDQSNNKKILAQGLCNGFNDSYKDINQFQFICSATKQMTSLLIMNLIVNKKIKLHDSIYKILGANYYLWRHNNKIKKCMKRITIYQLLTHTSGLYDYLYDPIFVFFSDKGNEVEYKKGVLESCSRMFCKFSEQSDHAYINTNFFLLGLVLENKYQDRLSNIFNKEIFQKLNMKNTFLLKYENNHKLLDFDFMPTYFFKPLKYTNDNLIRYFINKVFSSKDGEFLFKKIDLVHSAFNKANLNKFLLFSDGGVISTLEDVSTFLVNMHLNSKFCSAEVRDLIYYPQSLSRGSGYKTQYDYIFYGLGSQIIKYKNYTILGHSGNFAGYRFEGLYIKEKNIFIVLFGNQAIMPKYDSEVGIYMHLDNRQYDIKYLAEELITKYLLT